MSIIALTDELAEVVVARERRGTRTRVGGDIEAFFTAKLNVRDGSAVAWNFSATYAIERVILSVIFEQYYRGIFGPPSKQLYNAVNDIGPRVTMELQRMLSDSQPRAFERLMKRLGDNVERARTGNNS